MVVGLTDLQFAETYDGGFPQNENDCYIDTQGDLILSGNTMTGVVTEHDGCNGTILRDVSSKLILQRQ